MVTYDGERDQTGAGADATWFFLTLFNLFFTTRRYYLGSHQARGSSDLRGNSTARLQTPQPLKILKHF